MASKIEWTQETWNPWTGCTKVSRGCDHCYAETLALKLQRQGIGKYANGFELTVHPGCFDEPKRWKSPRMIFTCSMSDFFHERVLPATIARALQTMRETPQHTYQVLTKRIGRALRLLTGGADGMEWPDNAWLGTSVESADVLVRVEKLRQCPVRARFLSCEPLLGPLVPGLDLTGIAWVIAGGESGQGFRPMDADWARGVRDLCQSQEVPFFYKQGSGFRPGMYRELDGRLWEEMPDDHRRMCIPTRQGD